LKRVEKEKHRYKRGIVEEWNKEDDEEDR